MERCFGQIYVELRLSNRIKLINTFDFEINVLCFLLIFFGLIFHIIFNPFKIIHCQTVIIYGQ